MRTGLLIYGANGYTGRLIAKTFVGGGLSPTLAGRDAAKVKPIAEGLGLPWVTFDLSNAADIDAALSGVVAVLHCAGPFWATSAQMVAACLRTGAHYLDITGEIDVFEACARQSTAAAAAGVMLLPGCGFDVVPSDCLAVHVAKRLPDAVALRLSISQPIAPSRGTAATGVRQLGRFARVRRNGAIVELPVPPRRTADFGDGQKPTVTIGWGDVSTAFYSTGIGDIEVEFEATPQLTQAASLPRFVRKLLGSRLGQPLLLRSISSSADEKPDDDGSPAAACTLIAQVRNAAGEIARSRLGIKGAYWVTAQTALLIANKVLSGAAPVGFQTPALAYGKDLILAVPGSRLDDLDTAR